MFVTNSNPKANTSEQLGTQTFVLIHGGWAGGWAWETVRPYLEAMGHRVLTPDLPGRGSAETSIGELTLADFVELVVNLLDTLREPASSSAIAVVESLFLKPPSSGRTVFPA